MDKIETRDRFYNEGKVELRAMDDGQKKIVGEAIVFERESNPIYGEYIEVIKRGALENTDMSRVVARTGHDDGNLLGTTMGGTLRLNVTDSALEYEVDIPDTVAGRDTATYIERGDIGGSSFAFYADRSTAKWIDRSAQKMLPIYEIHNITHLFDVSPVINPAYPDAKSALRGFEQWKQEQADQAQELVREENIKADSDTLAAIHKHKLISR